MQATEVLRSIPIARPLLGPEEEQAVLEVLRSGVLAQGTRVAAFEEAFAVYSEAGHGIATSSGTTALQLALLAHNIGPGDEVITTPFTFVASANAVLYCGATPVFVDIDPATYNIDPDLIEAAITPRTRAILPVDLFGLPADLDRIHEIAERHGLAVIEDACQAHGARYRGRRIGSRGTVCFSFYPTKNMTTAEGGLITTQDDEVAARCRSLRQHGMQRRYYHDELGFNARMTDVHAAIGIAQLQRLDAFNERRRQNADYLTARLRHAVVTPAVPADVQHVFHQYTVRIPDGRRDTVLEELTRRGIGAGVYYPVPVHLQRLYLERGYQLQLPEAERAADEVLSLPIHPALAEDDLNTIADAVSSLVAEVNAL